MRPGYFLHSPPTTADGLLEGPTAVPCEKGGSSMAGSPFPTFRKEVQDCLRASEYLLSAVSSPTLPPLSQEEREMVEYYLAELGKSLAVSVPK